MANSAAFGTTNKYINYRIECTQNWQDIENNISNVTVKVFVWRTNTGYTTYGAGTCYCAINGTTYSEKITTSHKITSSGIYLFNKTLDIKHNDDGKKTLGTAAYIDHATFSSSSNSADFKLTDIPRTSSVTCNSFNIGSSTTINIGRASNTFTHTLKYTYGDLTGTIETKTSLTSVGWTPDKEDFYSRIPYGRTGYGTITCETYSGNTLIGTSTANFNAYAVEEDCKPDVSATIEDTNEDTKKLTGDSSVIIKYLSKPKVKVTATPKLSTNIKSTRISWGDGQTSANAEATFDGVTISSLNVSATDGRDYTTTKPYDLSNKWVEYIKLAFSNISLTREESTLSTAKVKVSGNYFNGSFGVANNSFTLKYRYRVNEVGSNFTNYIQVDPAKTNDTFDYSETLQNIDFQKEYIFDFVLEDKAMIVYSEGNILEKGEAIFRVGEDYVRVNGKILDKNGFDISLDMIYPIGAIYISSINVNPEALFGGKWAKLENVFLLGASATYPEGTTGGETTHTLTVNEMPSHTHQQVVASVNSEGANTYNMDYTTWGYGTTANQGAYTNATGGSQAHNNMPPYLAVHMWKRYE
jgi:hypothetical protein